MCAVLSVCVRTYVSSAWMFWAKNEERERKVHDDVSRAYEQYIVFSAFNAMCALNVLKVSSDWKFQYSSWFVWNMNMSHRRNSDRYLNQMKLNNEAKQNELNHIACHLIENVYLFTRECRVWIARVWANEHTLIKSGRPSIRPFVRLLFY